MDLLEPGGRKFVELGSGSPPEEGADAAITPTRCQRLHLKKAWSLLPPKLTLQPINQDEKQPDLSGKGKYTVF